MPWFVADLVVLITVDGAETDVVHVNTVLVEADDPQAAWKSALALGHESDLEYPNRAGRRVTFRFQGIAELSQVWDDPLEHGTELSFEERVGLSPADVAALVRPKDQLAVFHRSSAPADPRRPDYCSADVHADAVERLRAWSGPHLRLVTGDADDER